MKYLIMLLLLVLPISAYSATRDATFNWSQECATEAGDSLDIDGDGICEGLTGFRFYTESGAYLDGIAEDGTRTHTVRYNMDWGTQCHYMTAVMEDPNNPGAVLESVPSNTAACVDVVPGKPKAPILQ